MKLFSIQILTKIGVQAGFSNFSATYSKKAVSLSIFFLYSCRIDVGHLVLQPLQRFLYCLSLVSGNYSAIFIKFLKELAFQSSLGHPSWLTYSRKRLVTVHLFLGPVVSLLKHYSNLNLWHKNLQNWSPELQPFPMLHIWVVSWSYCCLQTGFFVHLLVSTVGFDTSGYYRYFGPRLFFSLKYGDCKNTGAAVSWCCSTFFR